MKIERGIFLIEATLEDWGVITKKKNSQKKCLDEFSSANGALNGRDRGSKAQ